MEKLTFFCQILSMEFQNIMPNPGPGISTFLKAWNSTIVFTLNRYYMRTKKSIMIHFRSWLDFIQKIVCWTLLSFYVQFTCLFLFQNDMIQFCKQSGQFWIPYGLPFAFQNCDGKSYKKLLLTNMCSSLSFFLSTILSCLIKVISVLKPFIMVGPSK